MGFGSEGKTGSDCKRICVFAYVGSKFATHLRCQCRLLQPTRRSDVLCCRRSRSFRVGMECTLLEGLQDQPSCQFDFRISCEAAEAETN